MTAVRVFADPEALGDALADEILAAYGESDGPFLLGCPGGRSLLTTYSALAARGADLSRLVIVMMDEYLDAQFHVRADASTVHEHEDAEIWLDRRASLDQFGTEPIGREEL